VQVCSPCAHLVARPCCPPCSSFPPPPPPPTLLVPGATIIPAATAISPEVLPVWQRYVEVTDVRWTCRLVVVLPCIGRAIEMPVVISSRAWRRNLLSHPTRPMQSRSQSTHPNGLIQLMQNLQRESTTTREDETVCFGAKPCRGMVWPGRCN
jgi:hypothetical protein